MCIRLGLCFGGPPGALEKRMLFLMIFLLLDPSPSLLEEPVVDPCSFKAGFLSGGDYGRLFWIQAQNPPSTLLRRVPVSTSFSFMGC